MEAGENTALPKEGAPALSPTLKVPHLPILSPSSWGCCTPPACSPDCGVSSPLMTLRRPCYTETQGLRPCQDTMSCPVLPEVPTARDIQPPGPRLEGDGRPTPNASVCRSCFWTSCSILSSLASVS